MAFPLESTVAKVQSSFTPADILAAAQVHAQVAVAVELYTIPFYLSALASIKNTTSSAYTAVLSVCTEEMLHLEMAANLCLALGTTPNFTAPLYGVVPTFPDGTAILDPDDPDTGDSGVLNATIANLVDALPTMLDIETPTEFETLAIFPPYHSIGQMYDVLAALVTVADSLKLVPWTSTNQQSIFGTQSYSQTITSLAQAQQAINVICEQGEGQASSPPPAPPFTASEFLVPTADQTANTGSVPADQAQYSHFGRFINVQQAQLTSADVYAGTASPDSNENKTLQTDFATLLQTLNDLWTGTPTTNSIWSMTNLLIDALKVWQAGNIPQWTPAS